MSIQTIDMLLVDSNRTFCEAVTNSLASNPYLNIVGEAHSGAEALALAQELSPDLLLTDITLSDFDTLDFINQAHEAFASTCIIIMSSYDLQEARAAIAESGIAGFVPKAELLENLFLMIQPHPA